MIACPSCAAPLREGASFCDRCGSPTGGPHDAAQEPHAGRPRWLLPTLGLGAVLVLAVIAIVVAGQLRSLNASPSPSPGSGIAGHPLPSSFPADFPLPLEGSLLDGTTSEAGGFAATWTSPQTPEVVARAYEASAGPWRVVKDAQAGSLHRMRMVDDAGRFAGALVSIGPAGTLTSVSAVLLPIPAGSAEPQPAEAVGTLPPFASAAPVPAGLPPSLLSPGATVLAAERGERTLAVSLAVPGDPASVLAYYARAVDALAGRHIEPKSDAAGTLLDWAGGTLVIGPAAVDDRVPVDLLLTP